jgi:hypothetical protein
MPPGAEYSVLIRRIPNALSGIPIRQAYRAFGILSVPEENVWVPLKSCPSKNAVDLLRRNGYEVEIDPKPPFES